MFDLAAWGQSQDDLSISHLILQKTPKSHGGIHSTIKLIRQHGVLELIRFTSFLLITRFEALVLRRSKHHADHLKNFDLIQVIRQSITIQSVISKSALVAQYADQDVESVKKLKLDVLIHCGWGILRGEILKASRYGVISLHNGDNRVNRGGPADFGRSFSGSPAPVSSSNS